MPNSNTVTSKNSIKLEARKYSWSFTKDGTNNLRTYLGNVEKGQPKVFTAPFAKGQDIQDVLSDWKAELESIQHDWPTLWEFENDLAKKVGPMSVQKPVSERFDDIRHYYDDILLSSTPISRDAMKATKLEWRKLCGLRIRGQKATVDEMKKSTNSGNPYFTKRRNVIQDTVPVRLDRLRHLDYWQQIIGVNRDGWDCTAVIGWRGQEGGPSEEDVKQRVVWMFPFGVNICELQVYQPLIEGAQALNLVPAWVSMDAVDREITDLFDSKSDSDLIVCTDFSKFDQHFNKDMQACAQDVLDYLLTGDHNKWEWLDKVFPLKYCIPLAVKRDTRWTYKAITGKHGMASGSGGTNVDETLAHRCLQHEAAILHGEKLNPHSMCLGDDGILTYPGITVDDVVDAYQSHGQECNKDKQYASSQDCVYLRRWHHKDYRINGTCVGVYSTCRAIGRLRYLERFMDPEYWSPELVALRQLSIIENCKWHPMFHEFIEFCMKRDKYRLGIDIPGFLDNLTQLAKESIDHMPDFLGYTKTLQGEGPEGIADWAVVRYLKSNR